MIGTYEKLIVDEATDKITYIGYAQNDYAATSAAVWAILKIESASATSPTGVTTFTWAGAPDTFGHIWDNRAGLTYVS